MRQSWVRMGESWWPAALLLSVAAQPSLSYLLMGVVDGTWFPAGFWIASGLALVSVMLWLPARWDIRWGVWPTVFLASLLGAWGVAMLSSVLRGNVFLGVVAWLPIALAMIWTKRPTLPAVIRAADVFAWVLVTGFLLFLALELAGVVAHRIPIVSTDYELRTYWLPLSDSLGLPGRWAGPFAHPNLTSPIAVFLVVYGLWRSSVTRVTLVAAGVLVLLLTGTRSALGGLAVGVVILVSARYGWMDSRRKLAGWAIAALGVGSLVAVGVVATGQTFEGRVPMWGRWLGLSSRDPLLGIGDPGITLAIDAGELPKWAVHGHNVLLDPIVRYGVIAQLLVVLVVVAALLVTGAGMLRGRSIGLAILVAALVCGLFESTLDWRYLNAQLVLVLVSVLLAAASPGPVEVEARSKQPVASVS